MCPRCGNRLASIFGFDQGEKCESLSCLKCGYLTDPVIEANRKKSKPLIPVREYRRKPPAGPRRSAGRPRKQGLPGHPIGEGEIEAPGGSK